MPFTPPDTQYYQELHSHYTNYPLPPQFFLVFVLTSICHSLTQFLCLNASGTSYY